MAFSGDNSLWYPDEPAHKKNERSILEFAQVFFEDTMDEIRESIRIDYAPQTTRLTKLLYYMLPKEVEAIVQPEIDKVYEARKKENVNEDSWDAKIDLAIRVCGIISKALFELDKRKK